MLFVPARQPRAKRRSQKLGEPRFDVWTSQENRCGVSRELPATAGSGNV
jgi:hypothetical protein